jgi:hypothetical protein
LYGRIAVGNIPIPLPWFKFPSIMAVENYATKRYFISRYAAIEEISSVAHFSIIILS